MQKLIEKAGILIEALPYIQSFDGKVVVVKLGGSAMSVSGCTEGVLKDVVAQCADGTRPECPLIEALFRERTVN